MRSGNLQPKDPAMFPILPPSKLFESQLADAPEWIRDAVSWSLGYEAQVLVWRVPANKHTWAFYYFCKRRGDKIAAHRKPNNSVTLYLRRRMDSSPYPKNRT